MLKLKNLAMERRSLRAHDWKFEFQQRGGSPILQADFWCQSVHFNYPKEIKLDVPGFDYLMTSENKGYYRKGQREVVLDKFKDRLNADPDYLQFIFDSTVKRFGEFSKFIASGSRDWDKFVGTVLNLVSWFYIPWYITEFNFISDKVVSGLKAHQEKIGEITDLNNAAMILMFPDKPMGFQKEQEEFYKLVGQVKTGEEVDTAAYLERFGWMKTFILVPSEPLDDAGLREKIQTAIREKTHETYKLQQERKGEDRELVSKLESIISPDTELAKNIKDARSLAWLLTWSVEEGMRAFAAGIPWYKEIAKSIGLKYEDWANLTIAEVSESIKQNKSVVSGKEIDKRKKAHVLSITNGEINLIAGDEALAFIKLLNEEDKSKVGNNVKEILGKPASPGKVTGKARICPSASDSHIVEEGDILVCSMTTPDYVPAMKKAGAIVTDEGGLLCHAAIISRELGKPCVIATKIATKALKDGDLVEVDADNGIVRKLS